MKSSLSSDLARLRTLAFSRYKVCASLIRRFDRKRRSIDESQHALRIWNLYHWLLVPLSLWPVDVAGLANNMLERIDKATEPEPEIVLLLDLLGVPPAREACDVMGSFEHAIAEGNYEALVKCHQKFGEREKRLKSSKLFKESWSAVCHLFDVSRYRLKRGVIRRRMSQERNFRDALNFSWANRDDRFRIVFDALCYRWNLYGVQHDRPLLLKITVNPTPHGTMIFIPRYWSIDLARDLNWKEIGRLHHAHGAVRQGPKLSRSRMERQDEAIAADAFWKEAVRLGKKGDDKYLHVLEKLGKSLETDFSTVKRLLRDVTVDFI